MHLLRTRPSNQEHCKSEKGKRFIEITKQTMKDGSCIYRGLNKYYKSVSLDMHTNDSLGGTALSVQRERKKGNIRPKSIKYHVTGRDSHHNQLYEH